MLFCAIRACLPEPEEDDNDGEDGLQQNDVINVVMTTCRGFISDKISSDTHSGEFSMKSLCVLHNFSIGYVIYASV